HWYTRPRKGTFLNPGHVSLVEARLARPDLNIRPSGSAGRDFCVRKGLIVDAKVVDQAVEQWVSAPVGSANPIVDVIEAAQVVDKNGLANLCSGHIKLQQVVGVIQDHSDLDQGILWKPAAPFDDHA